jgi:acetoin utilization protein AcuB
MLVRDRMSKHPVTIEPGSSALSAMGIMQYHHLRHLPVVEASGKLVGILAERDLLLAAGRHLHAGMEVAEVMSHHVLTVHPEAPLSDAASLMADQKIGSVPVVDADDMLIGIVTESDIFHAFVELDRTERTVGNS